MPLLQSSRPRRAIAHVVARLLSLSQGGASTRGGYPVGSHRRSRVRRAVAVLTVMALVPLALIAEVSVARPASADSSSDYESAVLGNSPTAYWRLGESSGSTAVDDSPHGNDATYNGVTLGRPGAMLHASDHAAGFDGSSSYVDAGTGPAISGPASYDWTYEVWVRTNSSVSSEAFLMSQREAGSGGADGEIVLGIHAHRAEFYIYDTNQGGYGFQIDGRGPKVDDGKWHHIVGVNDKAIGELYVDGVMVGDDVQNFITLTSHTVYLGSDQRSNDKYLDGDLDEAAIYSYTLGQSAIRAHTKAARRPIGGAVGNAQYGSRSSQHNGEQACKGDPVNTESGNFSESMTDLATPGRGLPLNVTRTYNAQLATSDAPFGYGWSFPYGMTFSQTADTAQVTEEGGTIVTFYRFSNIYETAAPRFAVSLVDNFDGTVTFTRLNRESFTFDASTGELLSEQDLNGQNASTPYATTFLYTSGKLTTATDPAGRTYTFGWTGTHITSLTDSSSPARTVTYAYDGSGNLTDVYGVNSTRSPSLLNDDHTVFTYDGSHRMLTMRAPKFYGSTISPTPVTTNVYDGSSRVTSQTDPLGHTTTFDYTTVPGSTIVTDPEGNESLDEYVDGLLLSCTVGYGTAGAATTEYSYDPVSLGTTEVTDPNGHVWTATYDDAGSKLSATDPLNRTTTYTYNAYNEVTSITEPKTFGGVHAETIFGYDDPGYSAGGVGNLTSKESPLIDGTGTITDDQITYFDHSDASHPGDVTSVVDPDANTTTFAYDSYGDLSSQTAPPTPENGSGNQTLYGYDTVKGWLTSTVSPRGVLASVATACTPPALGCTTFAHDAWGHVTTTTDPLGHTTVVHYDANGNQDSTTDPDSNTTGYTFDAANQMTTVTRADSTTLSNDYYDDGRLHHQYDGATNATTYTYDPLGRLSTVADPNSRTTTYTYDLAGNQAGKADPGGSCAGTITTSSKCTTSTYNNANELTAISYSDGVTPNVSSITYDADGQRTGMTDGTGSTSWDYDSLHRLASATDGAGKTIGYGYNLRGEATSVVYPSSTGTVTRTYDAMGRVATVTDWLSHQTTFAYNADSFLLNQTNPNGTTDTNTANNADQLTGVSDAPTSTPGSPFASFAYGRDNAAQVSSVTSTGVPTDNNTYTYTALNQLEQVNTPAYGYDSADNLTALTSGATQGFDPANQLCWTSPTGASGTCGSPPADATTYAYDTRGNRTTKTYPATGTWTYGYDQANRLISAATTPKITSVSGATGHNVALRSDGTVWTWGLNTNGQLGDGTTTDSHVPIQVPGITNAIAVAAGGNHTLALLADGTVRAWGLNANGELGNNSTTESHTPVTVSSLTGVTAISAGGMHSLALKSNGTVWAWGDGSSGQLGNSSTAEQHTPVQTTATNLGTATAISAGSTFSEALKSDGTVWTWGANSKGQLGNNATGLQSAPVQVSSLTGATAISAGFQHALAVKSNGTAWAWGLNANGELGNNSTTDSRVPVQVSGITTATQVAAGNNFSSLRKSDGTVWSWGADANGRLGDNATTDQHTPVQTGTITATSIEDGSSHGTAVKSDGTVWTWGWNHDGQLGNNTTTESHIPIQASNLPGTATSATYSYNGDGLRQSKTVNATTTAHTWDTSGALPLVIQDNTTNYLYTPGGQLLAQIAGSTVTYYHHDQQGSTRALTNSGGTVIATYTYDPYGILKGSTGGVSQPFGYNGQYTDTETGFQYLRARYSDPSSAEFLTRDPAVAVTRAPYGYVGSSPLNAADPTGMCPEAHPLSRRSAQAIEQYMNAGTTDPGQSYKQLATIDRNTSPGGNGTNGGATNLVFDGCYGLCGSLSISLDSTGINYSASYGGLGTPGASVAVTHSNLLACDRHSSVVAGSATNGIGVAGSVGIRNSGPQSQQGTPDPEDWEGGPAIGSPGASLGPMHSILNSC